MIKGQNNRQLVGGLALLLLGLVALAAQFIDVDWLGLLILPTLALIFLAWGLATRESGFLIPGGILAGLGAGTLLIVGPLDAAPEDVKGGAFLLTFALGWALIPILSTLFTKERHLWALIPGAIMALIGGALLLGGVAMDLLELLGNWWPVILIAAGLILIFQQLRSRN